MKEAGGSYSNFTQAVAAKWITSWCRILTWWVHWINKRYEISGSESFTRWLAPGSELGASWSEGSKTNVILGFRVPTTIGLRKPPAGSPCSQSIPWSLEPLGGQGAMGKVGASWSWLASLPAHSPHSSSLSALSSLPAHSQLAPSSLQPPSSLQLAPSSLPLLQLAPSSLPACSQLSWASQLTPACSQLSSASQLTPAHSSSLPLLQLTPSLLPALSSLPACSQLSPASQLVPLAPARSQLAPASQLAPLTPARSQLAPARSPCSSSLPAHSSLFPMAMYVLGFPPPVGCKGLWGKVGASWSELGSELEQAEWTERYTRF